jgi:hypothetical protein
MFVYLNIDQKPNLDNLFFNISGSTIYQKLQYTTTLGGKDSN